MKQDWSWAASLQISPPPSNCRNTFLLTSPHCRRRPAYLSSFGPCSGFCPPKPNVLMWSLMNMMSPTWKWWFSPPAAFVVIRTSTPRREKTLMGKVTCRDQRHTSGEDHEAQLRCWVSFGVPGTRCEVGLHTGGIARSTEKMWGCQEGKNQSGSLMKLRLKQAWSSWSIVPVQLQIAAEKDMTTVTKSIKSVGRMGRKETAQRVWTRLQCPSWGEGGFVGSSRCAERGLREPAGRQTNPCLQF